MLPSPWHGVSYVCQVTSKLCVAAYTHTGLAACLRVVWVAASPPVTTVGYGDLLPTSAAMQGFTVAYIWMSMGLISFAVGHVTAKAMENREEELLGAAAAAIMVCPERTKERQSSMNVYVLCGRQRDVRIMRRGSTSGSPSHSPR